MRTKTKKTALYIVLLAIVLLAIAAVLIYRLSGRGATGSAASAAVPPALTPQVIVREKEVEKLVEVEKAVTAQLLQDGLRDMGVLVTQEYYFTEVISASNIKTLSLDFKLFRINERLPFTESSFVASYDGTVTAGLDCAGVAVEKDDALSRITVTLPRAEILTVDVDPESFQLYDEKQGVGTRITVEDYNRALAELERSAADKAVERGILEKAEQNAQDLIRRFLLSVVDKPGWSVQFQTGA